MTRSQCLHLCIHFLAFPSCRVVAINNNSRPLNNQLKQVNDDFYFLRICYVMLLPSRKIADRLLTMLQIDIWKLKAFYVSSEKPMFWYVVVLSSVKWNASLILFENISFKAQLKYSKFLFPFSAGVQTNTPSSVTTSSASKKNSSRRNAWGNLSYADLITQAISSAPDNRLTLSQIYEWMVQNVPYFKDKGDSNSSAGWKVSNLF